MIEYGTQVVGGVTRARAAPPTSTCRSSTPSPKPSQSTGADASVIYVPPPFAADAILEAAAAGIKVIVASPKASRCWTCCASRTC
jgi:succinyl-CoA synthetase alpha subunit